MDQSNKNINKHQLEIEKLLKEIKALEQSLKSGNTYKYIATAFGGITLAGLGVLAGAAAAPYLFAETATEIVAKGITDVAINSATEAAPALLSRLSTLLASTPNQIPQWGIPAAAAGGDLALGLIGAGAGYRWGPNGTKEKLEIIQDNFKKILDNKIKIIKEAEGKTKINFIFNEASSLYPEYQKKTEQTVLDEIEARKTKKTTQEVKDSYKILPQNMADYIDKLESIFIHLLDKGVAKRPIIEKIEIKNAEMNDDQLQLLLYCGFGRFKTKRLDLSNNRLTNLAIKKLLNYSDEDRQSFCNLKSLNLSNNNLTEDCLPGIQQLVARFKIEELNLSGNVLYTGLNRKNKFLENFIEQQSATMPTLKVLKMANTNLPDKLAKTLKKMLPKYDLLTHVDISDNESFRRINLLKFDKLVNEKQKIRELVTDLKREKSEKRTMAEKQESILGKLHAKHAEFVEKIDSPFIKILNAYSKNKYIDMNAEVNIKGIDPELVNVLDALVMDISLIRNETLGVAENFDIVITEDEYIYCKLGSLSEFYECAIQSNDISMLDPRLFENAEKIEEIRAKQPNLMKINQDNAREPEPVEFVPVLKPVEIVPLPRPVAFVSVQEPMKFGPGPEPLEFGSVSEPVVFAPVSGSTSDPKRLTF